MWVDAYDIGPIRPPSEAQSLLIRVNRNCPWNRCAFCTVYKGTQFQRKSVAEVKDDIDRAAGFFGPRAESIRTAFLQDANALLMKTGDLVEIIEYLKKQFPGIERVTSYARAGTVARKTQGELEALHRAGLERIHMGLESGSAKVLEFVNKGTTPEKLVDAGVKVRQSGISLSEYVMPGLGGKRWWREHALETARVLNEINPNFIRVRSYSVRPDSPMFEKQQNGDFEPLTEVEKIREIRLMIEHLNGITSTLVSDHILNLLQELEGTFPDAKSALLETADRFLGLSPEEQENFMVGVRLRIYFRLHDMDVPSLRAQAAAAVRQLHATLENDPGLQGMSPEDYIRKLMESVI